MTLSELTTVRIRRTVAGVIAGFALVCGGAATTSAVHAAAHHSISADGGSSSPTPPPAPPAGPHNTPWG